MMTLILLYAMVLFIVMYWVLEVIVSNSFRLEVRRYFFTYRVIDEWNSLDNVIVCYKLFEDFNEN